MSSLLSQLFFQFFSLWNRNKIVHHLEVRSWKTKLLSHCCGNMKPRKKIFGILHVQYHNIWTQQGFNRCCKSVSMYVANTSTNSCFFVWNMKSMDKGNEHVKQMKAMINMNYLMASPNCNKNFTKWLLILFKMISQLPKYANLFMFKTNK